MKQPDLGKKISELRLAKGLTQGELAEKCNLCLRTIQRIESAEVTPRSYTIKLIFESLDYKIFNSFGKLSYRLDRMAYRFKTWLEQFYKYVLDLFNLKTDAMRKITTLTTVFTLLVIGLFILSAESNAQTPEQIKQTIEKINNDFLVFFNKGEIESMSDIYRYDACLLPENCCDKTSRQQHWKKEIAKGYKITKLATLSLSISDTIAVEKGKWKIVWPSGPEMNGMYLTEWRFSDNAWRKVNDISGITAINKGTEK
ncbi:MAG: helix-turn-helix transcriptional regulator [Marinilabiliaceae bacterium]|nr:helix-turn-helix transcriptional regulator [Marinilabiliaceae bacterium]